MAKTIVTGNFKGGVGKTTNAVMIGYTLAKQGYKTLIVDFDPQANATEILFTTMRVVYGLEPAFNKTLFSAILAQDLTQSRVNIRENLDLLPSYEDLQGYEKFLYDRLDNDWAQDNYFSTLLEPLKEQYDYILIDVPPQLNKYTNSALVASDFVVIILQTHQRSFRGAQKYISHLINLNEIYGLNVELLGVLPVLLQSGNKHDLDILDLSKNHFGSSNMFKTTLKIMARLKRYDSYGITERDDMHDRKAHFVYEGLTDEVLERIDMFTRNNDNEEATAND